VLDTGVRAVASGAVVGVCGDVAEGVDVGEVEDGEGFISSQGSIFFQLYGCVVFEELSRRHDADPEDNEIGGENGAIFEFYGADTI